MKKIISILVLAAMLAALTACGAPAAETNAAAEAVEAGLAKQPTAPENGTKKEAAAEAEPAEETSAEEPAEAEPAEGPAEEPELEAEDMLGKRDAGNVYVNEALGIRAEFPSNWIILNEEEIAQLMGYMADSFSEGDLAELLRESGSLCDFYAAALNPAGETSESVNIMIEDLGAVNGILIGEESYLDLGLKQLEGSLGQMGMSDVQTARERISFAGEEHASALISADLNGVRIFERLVLIKVGSYMATVTASSREETGVDEILAFFGPCED